MNLRATLDRHPTLKAGVRKLLAPFRRSSSADYLPLADEDRDRSVQALRGAWQDDGIPQRQRAGVEPALAAYRAGTPMREFDALVDLLRPLTSADAPRTVLEVGCSSGYYADVFAARQLCVTYAGCDFSPAFIEQARRFHPELQFDVADATALPYADASFDVVVSGCCLLHIPDYAKAIAETARVARRHAAFHRTPVLARQPTRYFTKSAYGVRTVEIHFGESELVGLFAAHGLRVVGLVTTSADWRDGDAFAMKTYLCEKQGVR